MAAHERYQVLDRRKESLKLPFGYPTMIMIALFSPMWFAIMNKRLEMWKQHDIRAKSTS